MILNDTKRFEFYFRKLTTCWNKLGDMETEKDKRNGCLVNGEKNSLHLFPVSPYASGEGLPYAPVDWPCPGDKWRWKVGKRTVSSGEHFWDRHLYLPNRLQGKNKGRGFVSKISVEQYVRTYPGADVKAFFDSFSWKIPYKSPSESKGWLQFFELLYTELSCTQKLYPPTKNCIYFFLHKNI